MKAAEIRAPGPGEQREWEAEFEAAARRPLADIIASKTAANRVKDRETLPRLLAFREYWLSQKR